MSKHVYYSKNNHSFINIIELISYFKLFYRINDTYIDSKKSEEKHWTKFFQKTTEMSNTS
jgi:hypothetical protein